MKWRKKELSVQELEGLLAADAQEAEGDPALLLEVAGELLDRERAADQAGPDEAAALAEFRRRRAELDAPCRPRRGRPWRRGVLIAAVLAVLVALPVAASTDWIGVRGLERIADSGQMDGVVMEAVGKDGEITVRYFVSGKGEVTALGVQEIVVWREQAGHWLECARFGPETQGLWAQGEDRFGGQVLYHGSPAGRYRVQIVLFAENEAGRDTRERSFLIEPEEAG